MTRDLVVVIAASSRFGNEPVHRSAGPGPQGTTIENQTPQELDGARLYAAACAECHAADGTGQNWIGKFLQPNPTDFTSKDFAASFDLQRFIAETQDFTSETTMPSFGGVLTTDEVAAIAAYVRKAFVDRDGSD